MAFNVLVVDDSHSMRSVIKKIIKMSGFKMNECLEAENGVEALQRLKEDWVDVIVSDINMPVMTGMEMLKELKKDDLFSDIPVVIVSTESNEGRIQEALRCGAKGFIKKPFHPEECRSILYEVIGVGDDWEEQNFDEDDGKCGF